MKPELRVGLRRELRLDLGQLAPPRLEVSVPPRGELQVELRVPLLGRGELRVEASELRVEMGFETHETLVGPCLDQRAGQQQVDATPGFEPSHGATQAHGIT